MVTNPSVSGSRVKVAFVFPGQGSQAVGMGYEWAQHYPLAAEIFQRADQALEFSLSELCWQGPEEDLQLTENTQPAILTASVAMHAVLESAGIRPIAVAGHSLGEYSALVAAGSLAFEDAVRLVRERGRLMQQAVPVGEGAMAAVLGLEQSLLDQAIEEAAEIGVCSIANINSPQQLVIAGEVEAVRKAMAAATAAGARRVVELPVSAPFHCALMAPAREGLTPLLNATEIADATVPVIPNVDPKPTQSGERLCNCLIRQVDGTVRWVEGIETMIDAGVTTFVEVGPGSVLTGLLRRISREVDGFALPGPESVAALIEKLEGSS